MCIFLARTPAGRELDDDARTMAAKALLNLGKPPRIRCRRLVVLADVDMGYRRTRLEGLMRRFDLLIGGDRNGGIG